MLIWALVKQTKGWGMFDRVVLSTQKQISPFTSSSSSSASIWGGSKIPGRVASTFAVLRRISSPWLVGLSRVQVVLVPTGHAACSHTSLPLATSLQFQLPQWQHLLQYVQCKEGFLMWSDTNGHNPTLTGFHWMSQWREWFWSPARCEWHASSGGDQIAPKLPRRGWTQRRGTRGKAACYSCIIHSLGYSSILYHFITFARHIIEWSVLNSSLQLYVYNDVIWILVYVIIRVRACLKDTQHVYVTYILGSRFLYIHRSVCHV